MTTKLTVGNRTYEFATVRFPGGLPTRPALITDELTAAGVDGVLIVNNRYTWPQFRMIGTIDKGSMSAAQTVAEDLMGYNGRFAASLYTTVLGKSIVMRDIHLVTVTARSRRALGESSLAAIVEASFVLRPTKETI